MSNGKFLDKEEIARLRAICDAATPGPWVFDAMRVSIYRRIVNNAGEDITTAEDLLLRDAEFIAIARTALPAVLDAYKTSEESRKNLVVSLLDAAKMWAYNKERAEKAEVALEVVREALEGAHAYVDDIVGWSGSSGNWPLQELAPKLREALAVLPPKADTKADK